MSWLDQLRDGSFRGVGFKTEGHETEGGRRAAVFEYPQRDQGHVEDLGRKARQFTLEVFVIGADYMAARDALVDACEEQGPGTLIHPYLGTRTVSLLTFRMRETTEEGGLARFQLVFIEAGKPPAPTLSIDTSAKSVAAAQTLESTAKASFLDRFKTLSFPNFVELDALFVLNRYVTDVRRLAYRLTGQGTELYALFRQLQALDDNGPSRVRAPGLLVDDLAGIATAARELAATPAEALATQTVLLAFGSDLGVLPQGTPSRLHQRTNRGALVRLTRQLAASQAIQAVAQVEFDSYQAAAAARDSLADLLDDLVIDLADAGDDAAFLALQAARGAMIRDITARGGSLARLYDYRPLVSEPALVIANRLYGDAGRADEIVNRNGVVHPGFVPAGQALEVLNDD